MPTTKTPIATTRDCIADELRDLFPNPNTVEVCWNEWAGVDVRLITGRIVRVTPVDGSYENGASVYIIEAGRARLVQADLTAHGLDEAGIAALAFALNNSIG